MEEDKSTLRLIAEHLVLAVAPLRDAVTDLESFQAFMLRIGWQVDSLPPEYSALAAPVTDALNALNSLGDGANVDEVLDVIKTVGGVYRRIKEITFSPSGIPPVDTGDFIEELASAVFELLLVEYLAASFPATYNALLAVGIIKFENVDPTATRPGFLAIRFRAAEIPKVITEPQNLPERLYGWGTADVNFNKLAGHLHELFVAIGLDAYVQTVDAEFGGAFQDDITQTDEPVELMLNIPLLFDNINGEEVELGLGLMELPREGTKPAGLILVPLIPSSLGDAVEVATSLKLLFRAGTDIAAKFGVMFRGDDIEVRFPFAEGAALPEAGFGADLVFAPPEPIALFGEPERTRLQLNGASLGLALNARQQVEFLVHLNVDGLTLIVAADMFDGFLTSLFGGEELKVAMPLTLVWSSLTGLNFTTGAGITISIAPHLQIGPVEIERFEATITSTVSTSAPPDFKVAFAVSVAGELGPLTFVVQGMGLSLALIFREGNAGPFDVKTGFNPPSGLGLSLDAGGFKGGGFLRLDSEKGEYVGALELDFNGLFSVKAIGIINTKMPDGKKGFSLLIVIAAEFTPIQLTFGFTLNGVGGIFGLNRRIAVAALAEGIRTNAIKSILFPENVVANITRIISDIKQFFPQQKDHFVIGPMAKLGWGTPSIITVELGLLLDLPDPMFAIVGVLKALLPNEEAPILRLQVNFIGVVDFDRGYIFFRADLFDSRLLVYSITGSMAFLVSWGEAKALALSVGGFHPDFRDIPSIPALPDGFRRMARIGISLLSDDNPRLKIESYFAITANTLQFGARAELYAEQSGFNIYGFLGFDVLFIRDPLSFVAKLSGGIALRRRSSVIAGVNISATLTGPTPWDARGKATLSFLFFSISVGFHATWGSIVEAIAGAVEDLLKVLQRELADTRNWRADLPPNNHLHVSLREIKLPAETDMLVIHPAGVLTFNQRSLPLEDFAIAKFGSKKPLAANKFKLSGANSQGQEIPADYQGVREQFAPANFLELSDSEKLSRKSFDNLPSGFKLTATADLLTTLPVVRDVEYELSYLRRERIVPRGLIKLFVLAYDRLVKGSAVRQSGLAQQQTRVSLNAPAQVGLPLEAFVIANTADLKSHVTNVSGPVLFATQAEAYQRHQDLIAQNPALAGQIQVVSHFELNPN